MELFPILDQVLIKNNNRPARANTTPKVWPSEASAELFDQSRTKIVGKCHRASFLRMIGRPVTNPIDAKGARIFALGHACEANVVASAKAAGIFVASGIRIFSKEANLSFELDLVVLDPESDTYQGYIIENKSIYGYAAESNLNSGEPKMEGIMQLCLYLNEVPTGAALKQAIQTCRQNQADAQEKYRQLLIQDPNHEQKATRSAWGSTQIYRMEVDEENLAKLSDGKLLGKTAYESRGSCDTWEYDVSIEADPFDGLHYPRVAKPGASLARWDRFTIESIYERFHKLSKTWEEARAWAVDYVAKQGHTDPTAPDYEQMVTDAYNYLPVSMWPPAEYEWRYTPEKIQKLYTDGKLTKTETKKWEAAINPKRRKEHELTMGDWNCGYCAYKKLCLGIQFPNKQFAWDVYENDDVQEAA